MKLSYASIIFVTSFLSTQAFATTAPATAPVVTAQASKPPHVVVKEEEPQISDSDKAITLTLKKPNFTISLPSNPTTGFMWLLKSYDSRFITVTKEHFAAPKEKIPGKGGVDHFTFHATPLAFKVPSVTYITLLYGQPWNLLTATEKEFTIITTT